jgi:hypothetical protein
VPQIAPIEFVITVMVIDKFNHLTSELNPSVQHYLPGCFTGDFNF